MFEDKEDKDKNMFGMNEEEETKEETKEETAKETETTEESEETKEEETGEETGEETKTEEETEDEEGTTLSDDATNELIEVINQASEITGITADKFNVVEKNKETIEKLVADKEEYLKRNQKVFDAFKKDPFLMDIMRDSMENEDVSFIEAFVKNVDPALVYTKDGDPDNEAIKKLYADRKTKDKEISTFKDTLDVNSEESNKVIESFLSEKKFTDEKKKEFTDKLSQHMNDLYSGKITKEFLALTSDGFTKPEDVKKAKVEGLNANIKKNIKPKPQKSDELPNLKGSNKAEDQEKTSREKAAVSIFDTVESASSRENIFNNQ